MNSINTKKRKDFVSIKDAAIIFDLAVATMRKYKNLGLIQVAKKNNNQDLFNLKDLQERKKIILQKKIEGFTLRQISKIINQEKIKIILLKNRVVKVP